jgi:peptidyl-prolyl cis-trans isomerase SurA
MRRASVVLALIAAASFPAPRAAFAQEPPPAPPAASRSLDRILAVVGNRAILASQIEEDIVQMEAQGRAAPTDSAGRAALRRQMLEQVIEEELLAQAAQRDTTVKVTEEEVRDQVEQTYQNVRRQFSTEAEFREQLRLARFGSVEDWRRMLTDDQRRAIQIRRLIESLQQQGKLRPIPPSDAEMREFWEANRAAQPRRPAVISFRQIVMKPEADSASRERARRLADSLVIELRRNADFSSIAKRFSADTASREQGGELGWFRRGVMVKEFEDVAFRLRPGTISDPVETSFGFHIIRVERTQPAEILARHILITPEVSPAQVEVMRRRADSVHALAARGLPFDSLARIYADPEEPKLAEDAPVTDLPPEYKELLATDTTLGLKPVVVGGAGTQRPKFTIVEVTARHAEGELTFDDVKQRIRASLGEQLAIRRYIDQLRRQTYVDVRL